MVMPNESSSRDSLFEAYGKVSGGASIGMPFVLKAHVEDQLRSLQKEEMKVKKKLREIEKLLADCGPSAEKLEKNQLDKIDKKEEFEALMGQYGQQRIQLEREAERINDQWANTMQRIESDRDLSRLCEVLTRYFVVRSQDKKRIMQSLRTGQWTANNAEQAKQLAKALAAANLSTDNSSPAVVLVFAVDETQTFEGFAELTAAPQAQPGGGGAVAAALRVEWRRQCALSYKRAQDIKLPEANKSVVDFRGDLVEVPQIIGQQICLLLAHEGVLPSPIPSGTGGFSPNNGKKPDATEHSKSRNIAAMAARNLGGFIPSKIFVGGVPTGASNEQFRSHFAAFGEIARVELHAARGFGYVTYTSPDAADSCLEKYDEHFLLRKWVEVKRSIPPDLIDRYEVEQQRLKKLLDEHGEIPHMPGAAVTTNAGQAWLAMGKEKPRPGGGAAKPLATLQQRPGGARPATPQQQPTAGPGRPKAAPAPPPRGTIAPPAHGALRSNNDGGAESMGRIKQLKEMGFTESVARKVLGECGWDVNRAIDRLLLEGVPEEDAFPAEEEPPLPAKCAQDGPREEAGVAFSQAEEPQPRLPPPKRTSKKQPEALATWPVGEIVLPPPSNVTRPPPPKAGPPPPKPSGPTTEQTPQQQAVVDVGRAKTDENFSDGVSTLDPDAAVFKPAQPHQPMHPAEVARPWRQQLVNDEKQMLPEGQGWGTATGFLVQLEKQPEPFPTGWGTINLADAIIPSSQQSLNKEVFTREHQMTEQQEQPQQHQPHYSATPQQPEKVQEVQQVQQQQHQQEPQESTSEEPHTPRAVPPPAPCVVKVKEPFDGKGLEETYGGRKFLKVEVGDEIGLISWNYMGSGWSFARQHRGGWNSKIASPNVRPPPGLEDEIVKEGWIPRDCLESLDVHAVSHNWEETPENTRPYLKLTCGEKVLVEQRYDSGWWYGYGIKADGMLSDNKGYFPANFCTAGAAA